MSTVVYPPAGQNGVNSGVAGIKKRSRRPELRGRPFVGAARPLAVEIAPLAVVASGARGRGGIVGP